MNKLFFTILISITSMLMIFSCDNEHDYDNINDGTLFRVDSNEVSREKLILAGKWIGNWHESYTDGHGHTFYSIFTAIKFQPDGATLQRGIGYQVDYYALDSTNNITSNYKYIWRKFCYEEYNNITYITYYDNKFSFGGINYYLRDNYNYIFNWNYEFARNYKFGNLKLNLGNYDNNNSYQICMANLDYLDRDYYNDNGYYINTNEISFTPEYFINNNLGFKLADTF